MPSGSISELFRGATPVLAGVDAASSYCYLLAAEGRRDADMRVPVDREHRFRLIVNIRSS